jgi:hypothetical protein
MHDAPSAFTAWSNFYVIVGSSAAALTGLMFVVVTLVAGERDPDTDEAFATFSTPTVVHFGTALLVSAILSAPWHSIVYPATILGISGLCGTVYVGQVIYRTRRQGAYEPQLDDWVWYAILPLVAYIVIAIAAFLLPAVSSNALFALAGAVLLLVFIGIHNAWDVVTYIALLRFRELNSKGASAGGTEAETSPTNEPR